MKVLYSFFKSLKIRDLDLKDFKDVVENYYMLYDEVKENKKIDILLYKEKPDIRSELEWFFLNMIFYYPKQVCKGCRS